MSTQFEFRLLASAAYEAAVRDLERVAGGDDSAVRSIQARCREQLERGTFARWHAPSIADGYLLRRWTEIVNGLPARASAEAAESIAEVFIALTCMPEYQMAYEYGTEWSPNLVVLGESDGGLYGVLGDADPWFDGLLIARRKSVAKYPVGHAMIVLDRAEVKLLEAAIGKVTDAMCANAPWPDPCRNARGRLAALVGRCLARDDAVLAVSESGSY